jgi:glycosyltransferase involved in cell wall biosynthesis
VTAEPDLSKNDRLPRVLVVTSRLDIGGTEQHLLRVLPLLRRRGLDISLYVLERGGKLEEAMLREGVSVSGPVRRMPRHLHALSTAFLLRRHLLAEKPDILHVFLSEPYLVGSLAACGQSLHRIMSRRSLNVYQRKHPMLARIERWLHAGSAALLGNSSAVVADLLGEGGDPGKVGLIRNGLAMPASIDADRRRKAREQLQIPPESLVFAVNANLIPYKGHRDLFAALGRIRDRLPAAWHLVLIGRDDGLGESLRKMAKDHGFADRVKWLGERRDAQDLLAAADIFVLPSHEEGFSNSLIEAMGCSLPVVATRVGGNIDAVTHDATGLLVTPKEPAALGDALLRLSQDAGLRRRLGAAARARVMADFTIEDCVRRYFNLYAGAPLYGHVAIQDLIDGRHPPQ